MQHAAYHTPLCIGGADRFPRIGGAATGLHLRPWLPAPTRPYPRVVHPGSSSRRVRIGGLIALAVVVAGLIVVAAPRRGGDTTALGAGERNPLASTTPRAEDTAATAPTPTTTPPATVPAPVPMVLPAGPATAVSRVTTTDPVIFLGIDDGLVRDPAVLDYLAANRIPFSAFLVANALQADPAFWARARAIGGTVQAHTLTHPNLTKASADQIRREVCGSADLIQQSVGVRATLFRPPYGAHNETVRAIAAECGFSALVMWKGATNDGRVDLQEQVLKPGDILLMHWRADLLTNLQAVKAMADAQGLRIARLEDYLAPAP